MVTTVARLRRHDDANIPTLVVAGEVDVADEDSFAAALHGLIADARSPACFDLREVSFFGSTGVNLLLRARDEAIAAGVQLDVLPSRYVTRTLEVLHLTDVFELA